MKKIKLLLLLVISLYGKTYGQDLPKFKHLLEENLDGNKELVKITYIDSNYFLDSAKVKTIKTLKDSICKLIKSNNIDFIDIPTGYVSLHLDRNAKISVLDSIRNELQGLNLLTVLYKLEGEEKNGYLLRLNTSSKLKINYFNSIGQYYPNITEWNDCIIESETEREYTEEIIPITRQTKPKDILLRLKNDELKNVENNRDLYVLSFNNKKWSVDNEKIKRKYLADKISNILEKGNYTFIIKMDSNNTYENYIESLYYIIQEVENKREKHAVNLIRNGNKEDYSKYFARRKYPISLLSLLPSDSEFINNNR